MDIEVIKKLIRKYQQGHTDFIAKAAKARAYYRNETDIMFPPLEEEREKKEKPLRNADNCLTSMACWSIRRLPTCSQRLRFLIWGIRMPTRH